MPQTNRSNRIMSLAAVLFIASILLRPSVVMADIVIIVHPKNPITRLSEREVRKIFLGRLRQFPHTDQTTDVIDQAHTSPRYEAFYTQFIGMSLSKLSRYRAAYLFSGRGSIPTELSDDQSVLDYVAIHSTAIGYINSKLVTDNAKVVFTWREPRTDQE